MNDAGRVGADHLERTGTRGAIGEVRDEGAEEQRAVLGLGGPDGIDGLQVCAIADAEFDGGHPVGGLSGDAPAGRADLHGAPDRRARGGCEQLGRTVEGAIGRDVALRDDQHLDEGRTEVERGLALAERAYEEVAGGLAGKNAGGAFDGEDGRVVRNGVREAIGFGARADRYGDDPQRASGVQRHERAIGAEAGVGGAVHGRAGMGNGAGRADADGGGTDHGRRCTDAPPNRPCSCHVGLLRLNGRAGSGPGGLAGAYIQSTVNFALGPDTCRLSTSTCVKSAGFARGLAHPGRVRQSRGDWWEHSTLPGEQRTVASPHCRRPEQGTDGNAATAQVAKLADALP